MMNIQYDKEEIYCRKLGHDLTFNYCRRENGDRPCARINGCWASRIDVAAFLQANYTPEEVAYLNEPPKSRLDSIFDIIAKHKQTDK
jgi:hypothetical protein